MSEKIIDFADFSYLCRLGLYKACSKNCSEEICEEWKLLKTPTLADVCGKRELKDMTEEEIKDIATIVFCDPNITLGRTHRSDTIIEAYVETRSILHFLRIEMGEINSDFNKIKIIKWFIEHGFNVFGEEK